MKCIICHGEQIQTVETKEEIQIGNNVVHVPIRIPVCHTCGERYYDRRTVRYLEEVEQQLKKGKGKLKEVGKVLVYG